REPATPERSRPHAPQVKRRRQWTKGAGSVGTLVHQSAATVSRRRFRYLWFLLLSWVPVSLLPESLPEYRLSFLVVSLLAFWCRLMAEGSKAAVLGAASLVPTSRLSFVL